MLSFWVDIMKRAIYSVFGCPEYIKLSKEESGLILESRLIIGRGYNDVYATIYLEPKIDVGTIDKDDTLIIYSDFEEIKESLITIFQIILNKLNIDIVMDRLGSYFVMTPDGIVLETILWSARLREEDGFWLQKKPFLIVTQPFVVSDLYISNYGYSILFLGNVL